MSKERVLLYRYGTEPRGENEQKQSQKSFTQQAVANVLELISMWDYEKNFYIDRHSILWMI